MKKLFILLAAALFTLQISAQLVVTSNNISCYGMCDGSITIDTAFNAATPLTYSINGVVSALNTFSNMCAGTYVLEYLDASGNWYSPATVVTLTEPDSLYMFLYVSPPDTTLYEVGGTLPYAYLFQNGITVPIPPYAPWLNSISCIIDMNGCSTCDTISTFNYTCDSLNISLDTSTSNVISYSAASNIPYASSNWVVYDLSNNVIVQVIDVDTPSFNLNVLDTFIVCNYFSSGWVSTNLLSCTSCDTIVHDGTSWMLMSIGQSTAIVEQSQNKTLLKVTDLLGRKSKGEKNTPLFYIYNDGTVEKRIVIE